MDTARATAELPNPATPSYALEGTWRVSDARDAWIAPLGSEVVAPPMFNRITDVTSAFALQLPPGADRDDQVVECEMLLVSALRREVLASKKCTLHEAAHGWFELRARSTYVSNDEDAHLVFVTRMTAGPNPPDATVAYAVPRLTPASEAKPKLNVLVISVDALRADHLSCYGYGRATSPHIDAFLQRGVRFENAISTAPWTLPSYGALFTGDLPLANRAGVSPSREKSFLDGTKLEVGDFQFLSTDVATLAQRFATKGFSTAGFVSNPYLDGATEIDRGFQRWVMYVNRAQAGIELAERWIDLQGNAPWFAFVHLMDPHAPYTPPAPFDQRFAGVDSRTLADYPPTLASLRAGEPAAETKKLLTDLYDGEIAYTDDRIGAFLAYLDSRGVLERTLVVFHSDHGEEFWDHGGYEHGHALHDELLRVPLAFVMPGRIAPAKTLAQRVSMADVFPTILELAGFPAQDGIDGRSLVPLIDGQSVPTRDIISEALLYGDREQKAVSSNGLKLITDGGVLNHLYDLALDPGELHDLATATPERAKPLRELLLQRARHPPAPPKDARRIEFSPERRDSLNDLGYPGGDEPPSGRKPR